MKIIGALLWVAGIVMAGSESANFTANIAGLIIFIMGNLIVYKEHKNEKSIPGPKRRI